MSPSCAPPVTPAPQQGTGQEGQSREGKQRPEGETGGQAASGFEGAGRGWGIGGGRLFHAPPPPLVCVYVRVVWCELAGGGGRTESRWGGRTSDTDGLDGALLGAVLTAEGVLSVGTALGLMALAGRRPC